MSVIPVRDFDSIFASTDEIVSESAQGRMAILVDDENRENEGDLFVPAECVSPEIINFMAMYGRGLICLALDGEIVDALDIPMQPRRGKNSFDTAFTVSIEAANGVSTGISAADRAHTILSAIADGAKPSDIVTPGHIFPIRGHENGVLGRNGHTEATIEIAKMAGFKGAAVICEIMNRDGTMARLPALTKFADEFGMKIGTIADLIDYKKAST